MFGWLFKDKTEKIEENVRKGFSDVRKDIDVAGKWIKHLDKQDKQLFDMIYSLREELSSVKSDIEGLREGVEIAVEEEKNKQVFKKLPVLDKQTGVSGVQKAVQTAVQTGNFYDILKGLSANERLVVFTLMNSDMKLSYEDLAMLLGKERSTVRGQINSIKQKTEGLIEEISEKNGKKRVYVPEEIRQKLQKYAKVRVEKG
jgi:predicted transcriptional regulator